MFIDLLFAERMNGGLPEASVGGGNEPYTTLGDAAIGRFITTGGYLTGWTFKGLADLPSSNL